MKVNGKRDDITVCCFIFMRSTINDRDLMTCQSHIQKTKRFQKDKFESAKILTRQSSFSLTSYKR